MMDGGIGTMTQISRSRSLRGTCDLTRNRRVQFNGGGEEGAKMTARIRLHKAPHCLKRRRYFGSDKPFQVNGSFIRQVVEH